MLGRDDDTKTVVVVAVLGVVVVARGRPTIPRIAAPGAAAFELLVPHLE